MTSQGFPTEYYFNCVVRFLDRIKYNDTNYTPEERLAKLHHVYTKTAKHFAHYNRQKHIKVSPTNLQPLVQAMVTMVVYSWATASEKVMVDLSIHYTYMLVLDHSHDDNPTDSMKSFYNTIMAGLPQEHPWWQMVNNHFPLVLRHYGPFCGLNMVRSTTDCTYTPPFLPHMILTATWKDFQGCWVEQYNLMGFPKSLNSPMFLRQMSKLGQCVGGSIFPKERFDENELFEEITAIITQIEKWIACVNDLLSVYEEFEEPRNQTSLVNNYAQCNEITLEEGLKTLTNDTIVSSEQLLAVFRDKDPGILHTLCIFCQGYVTWHLCDPRHRLQGLHSLTKGSAEAITKFYSYLQSAKEVGSVDPKEWAYPSVASLAAEDLAYWSDGL